MEMELTQLQLSKDLQKWFCAPTVSLRSVRTRLEDLVHEVSANELGVLKVIPPLQLHCGSPRCVLS